jgi:archaellum component FlaC
VVGSSLDSESFYFSAEKSCLNSTERYRMSQEQFAMQNRELDNLAKRNTKLSDQYTRIDIELNNATEGFMAANSRIEQLRNECANLRAEKKIWEVRVNNYYAY